MDYAYIKQRITDLRIDKGVSEYQMSLDLGHSRSYMQNISSGRSKPSIEELQAISSMKRIRNRFSFKKLYPVCVHLLIRN